MTDILEILVSIIETLSEQSVISRMIISLILIVILVSFSAWQKLDMEKMFLVSFARGFIQIVLMGSILIIIFGLEKLWVLYIVLLIMCAFASYTTSSRYNYPNMFKISMIATTFGGLSVMTLAIFSGIIPYTNYITLFRIGNWYINLPIKTTGEYVVPMGSMVLSNTMTIGQITIERMKSDIIKSKGKIEAALALGDTPRHAIQNIVRESFRAGLLPTTNRVAILGIVNIPGLMSGMVIGGVNPVEAAVYQIIIFVLILLSAFIGSLIISYLFPRVFFTSKDQLNLKLIRELTENQRDKNSRNRKK